MTDEPHRIVSATGRAEVMSWQCACGAWFTSPIDYNHERARAEGTDDGRLQPDVMRWLAAHAKDVEALWWRLMSTAKLDEDPGFLSRLETELRTIPRRLTWYCERFVASHAVEAAAELLVCCDRLMLRVADARERRQIAKRHGVDEAGLRLYDWDAYAKLPTEWIAMLVDAANQVLEGRAFYVHPSTRSSLDAPDTTPL